MPLCVLPGQGVAVGGLVSAYGTINASSGQTLSNVSNVLVLVDSTAGNITITLNQAMRCPGAWVFIRRATNNNNTVTVVPQGADTIDGAVSRTLPADAGGRYPGGQYYTLALVSTGSSYMDMFQYVSMIGVEGQPGLPLQLAGQGAAPGILQVMSGSLGYVNVAGGDKNQTLSVTGGATIAQSAPGSVPLTIKQASSQTADSLQIWNSAATPAKLAWFDNNAALTLTSSAAAMIPLAIYGTGGQTGDLLQVKSSSSTVMFSIGANGGTAITSQADQIALTLKGNSTQTSDIFRVVNSASAKIFGLNYASGDVTADVNNSFTLTHAGNRVFFARYASAWADTVNTVQWYLGGSGVSTMFLGDVGGPTTRTGFSTNALVIGSGAYSAIPAPVGYITVRPTGQQNPTTPVLHVRGQPSQSGDFLQLLNDGGTKLTWIDSSGGLNFTNFGVITSGSSTTINSFGAAALLINRSTSWADAVTGIAPQWGGSAANSYVVYTGFQGNPIKRVGYYTNGFVITETGGVNMAVPLGMLDVITNTSTKVGLTIIGAASQTANLLQFRSTTATVLAVDPTGKITTPSSELILEQTGGSLGTSRLHLQNVGGGGTGLLIENLGLDLVNVAFKPKTQPQADMRLESRSGNQVDPANATYGEYQVVFNPSAPAAGVWFGLSGAGATGRFYIGGNGAANAAASWGGGSGPMVFLANDTADPSSSPTGGTLLFSSAGVLKARTPDGTVTQVAPSKFTQTVTAPTVAGSPYTVTHNLGSTSVIVQIWDAATLQVVLAQLKIVNANSIQLSVSANMPNNVNVVVMA